MTAVKKRVKVEVRPIQKRTMKIMDQPKRNQSPAKKPDLLLPHRQRIGDVAGQVKC
jgi:hypothetical protein